MRRALALLAVGLMAGVVGCGGDDEESKEAADNPLARAAKATRDAGSARVRLTVVTLPKGQQTFELRGVSRLDRPAARLRLVYARFPGVPPGTELEAIFAGERNYFRRVGAMRWTLSSGDPEFATGLSESLPYLGAVVGSVRKLGRKRLQGVDTTGYKATVDLDLVDEQLPEDQRDAYRKRVKSLAAKRLPVVAYVDAQGRLRRLRYSIDRLVRAPAGQDPGLAFVGDFYDFGATADFRPPPARLVNGG